MLFASEHDELRAAIVEPDRFGGTCLNRRCIPSKMSVKAADAARTVTTADRLGVRACWSCDVAPTRRQPGRTISCVVPRSHSPAWYGAARRPIMSSHDVSCSAGIGRHR